MRIRSEHRRLRGATYIGRGLYMVSQAVRERFPKYYKLTPNNAEDVALAAELSTASLLKAVAGWPVRHKVASKVIRLTKRVDAQPGYLEMFRERGRAPSVREAAKRARVRRAKERGHPRAVADMNFWPTDLGPYSEAQEAEFRERGMEEPPMVGEPGGPWPPGRDGKVLPERRGKPFRDWDEVGPEEIEREYQAVRRKARGEVLAEVEEAVAAGEVGGGAGGGAGGGNPW